MDRFLLAIPTVAMIVLAVDNIIWILVIFKHSFWLHKNDIKERRKVVSPKRLFAAAFIALPVSIAMLPWWIYLCYIYMERYPIPFHRLFVGGTMMLLVLLTFIHLFAIIARYSCLPRRYWPLMSYHISRIIQRIFKTKPYPE